MRLDLSTAHSIRLHKTIASWFSAIKVSCWTVSAWVSPWWTSSAPWRMAASTLSTPRPLPSRLQPGHASRRVPARLSPLSWNPLWRCNGLSLGFGMWEEMRLRRSYNEGSLCSFTFANHLSSTLQCLVWSPKSHSAHWTSRFFRQIHSIDRIEPIFWHSHLMSTI